MRAFASIACGVVAATLMLALLAAVAPSRVAPRAADKAAAAPRALVPLPERWRDDTSHSGAAQASRAPSSATVSATHRRRSAPAGPALRPVAAAARAAGLAATGTTPGAPRRSPLSWPAAFGWPSDVLGSASLPRGSLDGVPGGALGGAGGGAGPSTPAPAPPAPLAAGVVRRAVARFAPQPPYPQALRAREASGFVEALVRIDDAGVVVGVEIASSSGQAEFEEAVRSTVARWRFDPATRDGRPVATTLRRRFEFRMVDG